MLKRFVHYYKPHKKIFIADMSAAFLIALIGMGYPILTRLMLNDWVKNGNVKLIIIGSLALLGIYFLRMLLRYFVQYYGHIMGVHMQAEMRKDLFEKLQKLPYSYFDTHETGSILSNMTNDLFDVSELAHHGPENIFIAGFTILGSLIYLFTINWIMGLVLLFLIPIVFGLTVFFRKRFRRSMRASKKAIAKINSRLESSVTGIRVTKAYTNQKEESRKFDVANQEYIDARVSIFHNMGLYFSISQFVTDFFNVVLLGLGGLFLVYGIGEFNYGDYSAFIVSISLFISPINQLVQFMEQFESASAGFERFLNVLDEKEEVDKLDAIEAKHFDGKIDFNHVNFHYATREQMVLNDMDFHVEKGCTLALVGPSGGGKTTICHLLPRFYEVDSGSIEIDGKNIDSYTLASLRQNIGIVQQDVFLFDGSIRDNIAYGKPGASQEELVEAARKANILDYINSLPEGWDSQIGERGVRLSGGQKQRLSIARVFLKNPPMLILDEATSALDNTTEMLIQNSLDELAKGRTTIIVAHRLSTIKHATRILVISHGQIKEEGSHEELMKQNGIYKQLYELSYREGRGELKAFDIN